MIMIQWDEFNSAKFINGGNPIEQYRDEITHSNHQYGKTWTMIKD